MASLTLEFSHRDAEVTIRENNDQYTAFSTSKEDEILPLLESAVQKVKAAYGLS